MILLAQLACDATTSTANSNVTSIDESMQEFRWAYELSAWITFTVMLFVWAVFYYMGDRYFNCLDGFKTAFEEFDVRKAKLGVERDRAFLLKVIDQLFEERPAGSFVRPGFQMSDRSLLIQQLSDRQQLGDRSPTIHVEASDVQLITGEDTDDEIRDEPNATHHVNQASTDVYAGTVRISGLETFNDELKKRVKSQMPVSGLRALKLFDYLSVVLVYGSISAMTFFDDWGFVQAGDPYDSDKIKVWAVFHTFPYSNFRSVLGLAYLILVLNPFIAYLICLEVKFLLSCHAWTGWPRWASFAFFLPLLMFFENVLWWRNLLFHNLCDIICANLIGGAQSLPTWRSDPEPGNRHRIFFVPFYGQTQQLLYIYADDWRNVPTWVSGW